MGSHHYLRRSDLFLLRLWAEEGNNDGQGDPVWRGKIQRVVDGESHQFSDWDGLLAMLEAMLLGGTDEAQEGSVPIQGNAIPAQEGTENGGCQSS